MKLVVLVIFVFNVFIFGAETRDALVEQKFKQLQLKIENGEHVDIKDVEFLKFNEKKLKELFHLAKKDKKHSLINFSLRNINDKTFFSNMLFDNSRLDININWFYEKFSKEEIFDFLLDDRISLIKKRMLVTLIRNQESLKKIADSSLEIPLKIYAVRKINDEEFLFDNYFKQDFNLMKSGEQYRYRNIIFKKLSNNYLIKIVDQIQDRKIKRECLRYIDNEDHLKRYALLYKDYSVASLIKNKDLKIEIFWSADDAYFRENLLVHCFGDGEDDVFFKEVVERVKQNEIRIAALDKLSFNNNYSFFINALSKEETIGLKKKILEILYREVIKDSKNINNDRYNEVIDFFNYIVSSDNFDKSLKEIVKSYFWDVRKNYINSISDADTIFSIMIESKKDKEIIYCIKVLKKITDYPSLHKYTELYLDNGKIISDGILRAFISVVSNNSLLKRIYNLTDNENIKIQVINRIDDDSSLLEIIDYENQKPSIVNTALVKLKNQKKIKSLIYKFKDNEEYIKSLIWRCNDKKILKYYAVNANNIELALAAEMKLEALEKLNIQEINDTFLKWNDLSDTESIKKAKQISKLSNIERYDISLDKFFAKWHESYEAATDYEIDKMEGLRKDVHLLYNLYLKNLSTKVSSKEFIVLPGRIMCKIDTVRNDLDKLSKYRKDIVYIDNLRPNIKNINHKVLYLDKIYKNLVKDFIDYSLLDYKNESESKEFKFKLIKRYIPIKMAHWGLGYMMESHPVLVLMDFNKDRTSASLNYRNGYRGSILNYIKKDGKWKFSHKANYGWIE